MSETFPPATLSQPEAVTAPAVYEAPLATESAVREVLDTVDMVARMGYDQNRQPEELQAAARSIIGDRLTGDLSKGEEAHAATVVHAGHLLGLGDRGVDRDALARVLEERVGLPREQVVHLHNAAGEVARMRHSGAPAHVLADMLGSAVAGTSGKPELSDVRRGLLSMASGALLTAPQAADGFRGTLMSELHADVRRARELAADQQDAAPAATGPFSGIAAALSGEAPAPAAEEASTEEVSGWLADKGVSHIAGEITEAEALELGDLDPGSEQVRAVLGRLGMSELSGDTAVRVRRPDGEDAYYSLDPGDLGTQIRQPRS